MELNLINIAAFIFVIIALAIIVRTREKIKRKSHIANEILGGDLVEETPQEIVDKISGRI